MGGGGGGVRGAMQIFGLLAMFKALVLIQQHEADKAAKVFSELL